LGRRANGNIANVERLGKEELLGLLQTHESAIRELEEAHDQGVVGLIRRMERHRTEVISSLATEYIPGFHGTGWHDGAAPPA
jgi:hypothetical protein